MRIGEVAKRTGLNISNVRFYERKGLLSPERAEESNYREYTEDDVFRIKRILLYRKMGISVDTIYLLLNEQIKQNEVVQRQKTELQEQIVNLQGAIELCDLIMQDDTIDPDRIDRYLNYVHCEEEKGKRFAEITELLDDISEFTKENVFFNNPLFLWTFQYPRIAKVFSICFFGLILAIPAIHLKNVLLGRESIHMGLLLIYGVLIAIYGYGFIRYRAMKKRLFDRR